MVTLWRGGVEASGKCGGTSVGLRPPLAVSVWGYGGSALLVGALIPRRRRARAAARSEPSA
jgi:hypothetical protein